MRRVLFSLIASSFLYSAVPSFAQRAAERARIGREIVRTDRESAESARQWSMSHRVPRRIPQKNGTVIELVGVSDGHPIYLVPTNRTAALVTGTRYLYPGEQLGLGLTGIGLELGIWDSGHVRTDHRELAGRIRRGDESEVSDHATHVAGTLVATGIDPRARGMAFESGLTSYSWTNDASEMSNEADAGLLISNHSYSVLAGWHYGDLEDTGERWYWVGDPSISPAEDYIFGRYDIPAVQFDRVTYTNPFLLPVVAAGNDRVDSGPGSGPYRALNESGAYQTYYVESRPIERDGGANGFDTLSGAGVAKNVLTVGSIGYSAASNRTPTSVFSSFGPTDDGRVKPDIMGLGEDVFSLSAGNPDAYGRSSGTSMATPNVAGSLALLQQYHHDIYGAFMRSATLKGLVLHTASDLDHPGPDYHTGWGLLDARAAAEQLTASITNPAAVSEETLLDGEEYLREISVEEEGPVRLTLSWTDHPSARLSRRSSALDDPSSHLKNDLDLRLVHSETGTVYEPYALDRSAPGNPAFTGDNRVDPMEQIYVASCEPGRYVVTVTHKDNLYQRIPQPFSLLVSGAKDESPPVAVAHVAAQTSLDGVTLTWSTLYERSAGSFEIERGPPSSPSSKARTGEFVKVGELAISGDRGHEYEFTDTWSIAGQYTYRLVYVDASNRFVAAQTDVNLSAPEHRAVLSNYPNPFRDRTVIMLDLPKTQHVSLEVYDVMGRRVLTVLNGELAAGRHRLPIEGDNWAGGVYFARVSTPNGVLTHRMVRR